MKTTYKNLVITGKLTSNEGVYFPNDKSSVKHFKYRISVKNTETNKQVSFDFYDSNSNFTKNIQTLDNENLLSAFYCFIQDAIAGELSQADFCDEFGYDYFDGKKIHRLCQKSAEKVEKIIFEDIYDFANELQDYLDN